MPNRSKANPKVTHSHTKDERRPTAYWRSAGTVPFKPRTGVYERPNLIYNPDTCLGLSYNWYEIVKKMNNQVVLNTFRYNSIIGKQVISLRKLLTELGVSYIELEAPEGLQNLNACLMHHTREYAKEIEAARLADPSIDVSRISLHAKALSWLKSTFPELSARPEPRPVSILANIVRSFRYA